MKQLQEKQDFYEIRPLLFIVFGFVGVFNSFLTNGTPAMMVRFGQFCGLMLFFSAFKILKWRKDYRHRRQL